MLESGFFCCFGDVYYLYDIGRGIVYFIFFKIGIIVFIEFVFGVLVLFMKIGF